MSQRKKERCWTEEIWRKVRASPILQEREEVYATLQYAAGFHCLVEEWKECEELTPKAKQMRVFVDKKRGSKEASRGVVCGSKHIFVNEMRRSRTNMKIQGACEGPKVAAGRLQTQAEKLGVIDIWEGRTW